MLSLFGSQKSQIYRPSNSLRIRSSATASLSRTPAVAGNNNTFTVSFWVKRGLLSTSESELLMSYDSATNVHFNLMFNASGALSVYEYNAAGTTGSTVWNLTSSRVFRDISSWYHIVVSIDTTQATASDRVKLYINGTQLTSFSTSIYPSLNYSNQINKTNAHYIGKYFSGSSYYDGYIYDYCFIDGLALPASLFGQTNILTGVWSPKLYSGSFGTNGFLLRFSDASASTATGIGKDSSGNGNNWTPNGISVTNDVTYDSMLDVPINYANETSGRGNYATLNPLTANVFGTVINGNLKLSQTTSAHSYVQSTIACNIPCYVEAIVETTTTSTQAVGINIQKASSPSTATPDINYYGNVTTTFFINGVSQWTGGNIPNNTIIQYAFDPATGKVWLGKNNVWFNSTGGTTGNPSAGTNQTATLATDVQYVFAFNAYNNGLFVNFGQRPFTYTPPTGFLALNTQNLPTPAIVNGASVMAATTYNGNATARSLSNAVNNVSFQPDLVWIKSRTPAATSHALFDSTRGTTKYLSSDTATAETTLAQSLTAFNADGFSLGSDTTLVNASANSYIAWQWKESIAAGLDVVSYTGTGVDRTVAHNLGVAPAMIIVKRSQTGATGNWQVRHTSIAAANSIQLNSTNQASAATTVWASTTPTSSVFTVGTSADVNSSGISYVAYCFAEVAGFSKFGSYTGNGSADGPFVYCGFRPRFVLFKNISVGSTFWLIYDTTRNSFNAMNLSLQPESAGSEVVSGGWDIDILSNGFKLRNGGTSSNNGTGNTIIFAAWAENSIKYALAN